MNAVPRRWKRAAVGLLAAAALAALGWLLLPKPPLLDGVDWSRRVVDREGGVLRVTLTRDGKYRVFTPLEAIAPELIRATLTQEDRFFARHPGVNVVPLCRSAWALARHGRARAGASTISMQVARLRFRLHTRTLPGKAAQIFRAVQLERHYSKAQILEAYFNLAPYGRNLEGAGAASLFSFGKPPARLTLPEAVALSVIPQSPARRALHADRENPALTGAQTRLFDRLAAPAEARAFRARAVERPPAFAPHYVLQALREAARNAPDRLEIATALDPAAQRVLERGIRSYLAARREEGIVNAAALLLNARTMEVEAQAGSADFSDPAIRGQVDGTKRPRSPGSTLKPFVYALALDQGLIHPLSLLEDAPRRFAEYDPENFDRGFAGPLRACDALARSRNIPAVALTARLAHPGLYAFLQSAGVRLPRAESSYGLTLPLGGAEVTMQDLARLYGALANGGKLRPLHWLRPHGDDPGARLLSPEAAFLTLEMLGPPGNPPLDSAEAVEPVFWKTGTSNGFHDAWTVAVCGGHVLLVWIGNFDGRANPAFVGGTCAAPLLFQILGALRAEGRIQPAPHLPPPGANLRRVEFCAVSGQLPTAACKERLSGWFIPGISPIALCSIHREVLVDAASGLRVAADDGTRPLRREVYEFWPSSLLTLFAEAGLPRRVPPPFLPGSGGEGAAALPGKPVRILSPRAGVVYALRAGEEDRRGVPLQAESDGDVARVYWFAGKEFLGVSQGREPLIWHPAPGSWAVTAVDDHGRSDGVRVSVQAVQMQ
ncbi:MAG: penicillin-binding protein 1C [Chthoniobacteraceae bacterium]|nr:penicillin-binding protein 1C [Chthoniobacteraceae bacterium]